MIKLAIFDVDGTLLANKEKILLQSTIDALNTLKQNGIHIAIASGRPYFALDSNLLSKIKFDYFICSNGNSVVNNEGTFLYQYQMDDEDVEAISNMFVSNDEPLFFQFQKCNYVYHSFEFSLNMFKNYTGIHKFMLDDTIHRNKHLSEICIQGIGFTSDERVEIYKKTFPKYRFEYFGDNGYDIVDNTISKATGIQHLCEILDIEMKDTIAFGDHLNDIQMLEAVGISVAMGNALDEVKEIADYVTTDSDKDGIAVACRHFKLI